MDKDEGMRRFIMENFETTSNKRDRLYTQDILVILGNNGFHFSTGRTAQDFKSINISELKNNCVINYRAKAGLYCKDTKEQQKNFH